MRGFVVEHELEPRRHGEHGEVQDDLNATPREHGGDPGAMKFAGIFGTVLDETAVAVYLSLLLSFSVLSVSPW
jgi:hypothetical protein